MILLANIIAFIGSLVMVGIGFIKERKHILLAQCAMFLILGIANLLLGGVTGFIANTVSIGRNLYSLRFDLGLPAKILFIAIQVALSAPFNTLGLIGWLPILAAVVFTFFLSSKDERVLKVVIIFGQLLWAIYDIYIKNYSAFAFDILTMITNAIGIWQIQRMKKLKDVEDI